MKKITFSAKPTVPAPQASADAWVNNRSGTTEPTKRFTFDIPLSLHQQVKSQCALQGLKMSDVVREFLERRFTPEHSGARGGDGQSTD